MKNLIGLIGGTGYASTVEYYTMINEKVNARLGGFEYAGCLVYSLNYGEINKLNDQDDLPAIYLIILEAAKILQNAGVNCIVLCANTLHLFADQLEKDVSLPLIHIAEATALKIRQDSFTKVGLLGTKRTMMNDFYRSRLKRHGIETLVPEEPDRDFVEYSIRQEMVRGIFKPENNSRYLEIIGRLHDNGSQGVVLGCTEIPLIVKQEQTSIKLYDTSEIHAEAIVDFYVRSL